MIHAKTCKSVSRCLNELKNVKMTDFHGRKSYERRDEGSNYHNGFYPRCFTIKGIGQVDVSVPKEKEGKYYTYLMPRSKQMEEELRRDVCLMCLPGLSTRTLLMISSKLIGRRRSFSQLSLDRREFIEAAEDGESRVYRLRI